MAVLITSEELARHIGVPPGHKTSLLEDIVASVTSWIENRLQRPITDKAFTQLLPAPCAGSDAPLEIPKLSVRFDADFHLRYWKDTDTKNVRTGDLVLADLRVEEHSIPFPYVWPASDDGWPAILDDTYYQLDCMVGLDDNQVSDDWKAAAKQLGGYLYEHPTEMRAIPMLTGVDLLLEPTRRVW